MRILELSVSQSFATIKKFINDRSHAKKMATFISSVSNEIDIHSSTHNHVFQKKAHFGGRRDLKKGKRAPVNLQHRIIFAVKPLNRDELIKTLYDVSDPASINYGKSSKW